MARVVVTGGAGFVGSHLCDALLARGDEVAAVDNLITGSRDNVVHLAGTEAFALIEADVAAPSLGAALAPWLARGGVEAVLHFASPASPKDYLAHPLATLRVGSAGTEHALDLAHEHGARFLLASTSEVYGDPLVHPQPESYWGNVNPNGVRSVYDEAKRYAEALTACYRRELGTDTSIVRIFNTSGPRMKIDDGRVVSNFIVQALLGKPITVYGDGTQTRSFCYVDDEVAGILALLDSGHAGPVNIGNDAECTVLELAELVLDVTGSESTLVFEPRPADDPMQRRPDLTLARSVLGWQPRVSLRESVERTLPYFRRVLGL